MCAAWWPRSSWARTVWCVTRVLEQRVADLETLQAKLTAELADPATYAQGAKVQQLNAELQATTEALQTATNDWEKAAQKLSEEKK